MKLHLALGVPPFGLCRVRNRDIGQFSFAILAQQGIGSHVGSNTYSICLCLDKLPLKAGLHNHLPVYPEPGMQISQTLTWPR